MLDGEHTTICSMEEDESGVSSIECGLESKASNNSSNFSLTDASQAPSRVVENDSGSKEASSSSIFGTHFSPDTSGSSFASSANSTCKENSASFDSYHVAEKRMKYAKNAQRDSMQNSFDVDSFAAEEPPSPSITPPTSIDPELRFLQIEEIFDEMNEKIKDIAEITQLPFSTSRILLNHFNWEKDTLTSKYYESTNIEEFFRKCRVVNPASFSDISPKNTTDECRICLETSKTIDGEFSGALCGHKFCNICWDQYLSTKITNEGLGETISCAEYKCNIIVEDTFVTSMLTDPDIKLMYKRLLANNFIQRKQDWCWCPSPKCNLAIEVLAVDAVAICQCGVRFCHKCFDDWHAPVECRLLKIWKSDDSATLTYLAARTKECPKCKAPIEKNGGCNHMTCSRCPHQFCWICLGDWSSHNSNYECNRYKEIENVKTAKTQSNKLNHFWNRYCEHRKSLQFEQELSDKVTKVNETVNTEKSAKELECLQKGLTELLECRRMLMNTYVFVYYLEDDGKNNKTIFEANQADLEAAAERLSGLLQDYSKGDANEESIDEICSNIIAKYGYCKNRREILLKHVDEGNEKMIWRYVQ